MGSPPPPPLFAFSSRNPRLFIGVCILGYHGDVKSFAPLIERTIYALLSDWLVAYFIRILRVLGKSQCI